MTPDDSCTHIRPLLLEYALGQLPAAEGARVERHVAICADCRTGAEQWRALHKLLTAAEADILEDENMTQGWTELHARLHNERQSGANRAPAVNTLGSIPLKSPTHLDLPAPSRQKHRNLGKSRGARPLLALFAAAALIFLSFGVFAAFGGPGHLGALGGHGGRATATPAACAPNQYQVHLPAHASIASVAMSSAEDGWAVGTVWDPQGSTPPATLILHLQHCVWSPVSDSIPSASLFSVAVGANGEGWAVGATQKRDTLPLNNDGSGARNDYLNDRLVALHLVNGHWQREAIAGDPVVGDAKVQMVGASGWMLLDTGKQTHLVGDNPVSAYSYLLLRYSGSQWSSVPLSFKSSTTIIADMAAVSANEVWLAGYGTSVSDPSAIIARYSNGAWKTWSGNLGGVQYESLYHIVARSSDDVYVSGTNFHHTPGNDFATLLVLHFDGAAWEPASLPGNTNEPSGILYQSQPTGLAVTPAGDVWSFSSARSFSQTRGGYSLLILHARAGTWQVADAGQGLNIAFIAQLTMATATRGWAIADTYVQTDIGAVPVGHLILVDGTAWLPIAEHQV